MTTKKKKLKLRRWVYVVFILLFLGITVYGGVHIYFWYRDGLRKQFGSVLNNSARFDKHMFLHHLAEGIREEQRIQ